MPKPHLPTEIFLLVLLALLWGSSYLFIKIAVAEIPPLTLIATRVLIAAVLLFGIMWWRGMRLPSDWRSWKMLLVLAFFNSIGAWTVLAWGQQYVDSGLASVLNSTSPLFIFFFTLFFTRHEPVSMLKLVGALLGLLGVVLIIGVDVLAGLGSQVAGQAAALAGAILYACAAIYGRNFAHLPPAVTASATMIWAIIWLVPLALLVESPWELSPSPQAIGAALALGLFCTGIALLIYFRLLKTLGSLGVASQAYLRSGIGVAIGVLFLGEKFDPVVGVGLAAAILGVVAINLPGKTRQKK